MKIDRKKLFATIPWIFILLLGLEDIILMSQNQRLRSQLVDFTGIQVTGNLNPGDRVGPIRITTLAGSDSLISYDDSKNQYLLFVLSPTCSHCEKNLSLWSFIAQNSNLAGVPALGISIFPLPATRKYTAEKNIDFNLVVGTDSTFNRTYKISSVPQTILLSRGGRVQKVWVGELSSENVEEIKKMLEKNNTGV